MSFYLAPVQPGAAGMVFTGDALLIRGCGRTDFQQGNAGTCVCEDRQGKASRAAAAAAAACVSVKHEQLWGGLDLERMKGNGVDRS